MPFDMKGFMKAKFADRTAEVPVPNLAAWFGKEEKPVLVVRGLTGQEVARTHEAVARNKGLAKLAEAIAGGGLNEKVAAIKKSMGLDETVPDEIAKRVEQLQLGAVSPTFDLEQAVYLFTNFPTDAYAATNEIMRLSGMGRLPGESKPSGSAPTSGPA